MKNKIKNSMFLLMGMIFMGGSAYGMPKPVYNPALVVPVGSYQNSCNNIKFVPFDKEKNQLTAMCTFGKRHRARLSAINIPIGDTRTISNIDGDLTFDN